MRKERGCKLTIFLSFVVSSRWFSTPKGACSGICCGMLALESMFSKESLGLTRSTSSRVVLSFVDVAFILLFISCTSPSDGIVSSVLNASLLGKQFFVRDKRDSVVIRCHMSVWLRSWVVSWCCLARGVVAHGILLAWLVTHGGW